MALIRPPVSAACILGSEPTARGTRSIPEDTQCPPASECIDGESRVIRLLQAGDAETAFSLLEVATQQDPDRIELHGYIEMIRSQLVKQYRKQLATAESTVRTKLDWDQLMKFNLPPEAGFLLSLIEGTIPTAQLLSVSGFDEFRTLRVLSQLVEAGIVEVAS